MLTHCACADEMEKLYTGCYSQAGLDWARVQR